MSRLSVEDRVLLVQIYYMNNLSITETIRKFSSQKHLKKKEDAPTYATIDKLIKRFVTTGSVHDLPRSGRPTVN